MIGTLTTLLLLPVLADTAENIGRIAIIVVFVLIWVIGQIATVLQNRKKEQEAQRRRQEAGTASGEVDRVRAQREREHRHRIEQARREQARAEQMRREQAARERAPRERVPAAGDRPRVPEARQRLPDLAPASPAQRAREEESARRASNRARRDGERSQRAAPPPVPTSVETLIGGAGMAAIGGPPDVFSSEIGKSSAESPSARGPAPAAERLRHLLRPQSLRDAIILAEVLGPPPSTRNPEEQTANQRS